MSAFRDRSQGVGFYYGNAAKDLADQLPADDHTTATQNPYSLDRSTEQLAIIESLVDRAQDHIQKIQNCKNELSFLLADLKRMIG